MQVVEFARGVIFKRYGIAMVLTPDSPDALLDDFRHVKQAVLEWTASRGRKAELVMFNVMANAEHFDEFESLFRQLVDEETELAPVFSKLCVQLEFTNDGGDELARTVTLNVP